jgi:hypothetical protein
MPYQLKPGPITGFNAAQPADPMAIFNLVKSMSGQSAAKTPLTPTPTYHLLGTLLNGSSPMAGAADFTKINGDLDTSGGFLGSLLSALGLR